MSITAHWYTLAAQSQWNGSPVNWATDTINVALLTSAYTPAQDTDHFWSGISANEISGTGYVAGGLALSGQSVGAVVATHTIPLLASSSSWSSASFTCRYAVLYKNTGTAATSPLLGWVDFGANETVASGTFTIAWDATNGALSATAS